MALRKILQSLGSVLLLVGLFLFPTFIMRPVLLYLVSNKTVYAHLYYWLLFLLLLATAIMRITRQPLSNIRYFKALQYGAIFALFAATADLIEYIPGVSSWLYLIGGILMGLFALGTKAILEIVSL